MERPHLRFIDGGPMAPTPSIGAATAPGRALGEFGRALEGLGDKGFQIATQIREWEEAGKMSAWRANADERANKFSNSLLTRHDPDNWVEDWSATSKEIGAELDGLGLSPVAKQRAKLEYDDWSSGQSNRLSTQAAMRVVSEGKARVSNAIAYQAARGNHEGVRLEVERAGGLLSPSEKEKSLREADRIANKSLMDQQLEEDPAAVLEDARADDFLDRNPGLTSYDQEVLQREAENRVADLRGADMERLDAAFKDGSIRPVDIESAPNLTPEDRAAYAKHMAKATPPTREELATQWDRLDVLRRARNDPGMTPEIYRDIYYETKAGVLNSISPNYQGELSKELSYLSPAGRNAAMESGPDAPVTKEDLLGIGRSMISRARSANAFGDIETGTPEVKEKAWRQAEDAELELKRFVAANPDATPDDIRAHADALISGTRTNSAKQSLRSFVPGTGASLRGAVFPPVPKSKARRDGGVEAPAGQGESSDLILPPRDDLDQFLNDGN